MCVQVLASIGQLEFFYDQAPDVMRSCSMALQLLSVAIGSYLSGAVVLAVSYISDALGCDWLPQDLNYGRLDLFFLLLAGAPAGMLMKLLCRICLLHRATGCRLLLTHAAVTEKVVSTGVLVPRDLGSGIWEHCVA